MIKIILIRSEKIRARLAKLGISSDGFEINHGLVSFRTR